MISAVGVKKLNIKGLGDKMLERLVNDGRIKDIYDLLTLDHLYGGAIEAKVIPLIVEARAKNPIAVLNITGVGSTYSKIIEPQITKLTDLLDIPYFTGIGDSANHHIKAWNNRELLEKLDSIKTTQHYEGITGVTLAPTKNDGINKQWIGFGGLLGTGGLVLRENIEPGELLALIKSHII